jgi:hypothetical protein
VIEANDGDLRDISAALDSEPDKEDILERSLLLLPPGISVESSESKP